MDNKDLHIGKNTDKAHKKKIIRELARVSKLKKPHFLNDFPLKLLPYLLDSCPYGDGELYERLVLAAMCRIMGKLVDYEFIERHTYIKGGFSDIELPFCSEMLSEIPQWGAWYSEFKIKLITVEVKNLNKKAMFEHVVQIKDYSEAKKKGKLNFLVSRKGFTKNAVLKLKSYAEEGHLILPLDNDDLISLIKIRVNSPSESESHIQIIRFLRRQEIKLYRFK